MENEQEVYIESLKQSLSSRDKKITELELQIEILKSDKMVGFDEDKKIWKYNLYLMGVLKNAIKSAKTAEKEANDLIGSIYDLKKEWTKDINNQVNKPIKKITKKVSKTVK